MKEEKKESKKKKSSSKKSSRKRGFFSRLFIFLLTILAVIGVMAMAMSVLSSYVDPVKFPWMAYFGLAFWVIFLYNIMILMFLLLLWSRMAWFSIIALIISIPGVYKSFSAGSAQEGGELRVMSYNVLNFSDYHGLGKSREEVANRVANFVPMCFVSRSSPNLCRSWEGKTVLQNMVSCSRCLTSITIPSSIMAAM